MSEMILLGAGASVEAGVPDAVGMTTRIIDQFQSLGAESKHAKVILVTVGGLLFRKGIQNENLLTTGVNVEELFNAVQLLAERNSIEAAPFVGSWHTMVDEFDKVRPPAAEASRLSRMIYEGVAKEILGAMPRHPPSFGGRDIDRNLETTIKKTVEAMIKNRSPNQSSGDSVAKAVGEYVVKIINDWLQKLQHSPAPNFELQRQFEKLADQQPRPGEGRIFEEIGERMIRALANIVMVREADSVQYLAPIVNLLEQQRRVCVATLNYDNTIELLCERHGVKLDTGIEQWSSTGSFQPPISDGVLLLKLHGSIDWQTQEEHTAERPMLHRTIRKVPAATTTSRGFRPAVIFGHRNKLTAEGPFLDLLRGFRDELTKANRLTVVGYSFGDRHINVYLSQWLNSDPGNRLRVIAPHFGDRSNEYVQQLRNNLGARLEVVRQPASRGLIEAFGGRLQDVTVPGSDAAVG